MHAMLFLHGPKVSLRNKSEAAQGEFGGEGELGRDWPSAFGGGQFFISRATGHRGNGPSR